ncbi:MAG: SDR family NAD(P)-dependent oxidoreductase, partial [Promethearchaeota archaeon]
MLLEGKNIVLTGAGRGIGKHVAIAYGKEGANLGLIARTESELNDTKKE